MTDASFSDKINNMFILKEKIDEEGNKIDSNILICSKDKKII